MSTQFEISVKLLEECGYFSAMYGLSFNKDKDPKNMPKVAAKLCKCDGGHNKFLEQIIIWMEVKAPRYWWQEADTYRLSSKSSQSTMHTILNNKLKPENFECCRISSNYLGLLNDLLENKSLIILKRTLPEGFMQKRMWMISYKTLRNIFLQRRNHRLPHWKKFIIDILNQIEHPELLPIVKEK